MKNRRSKAFAYLALMAAAALTVSGCSAKTAETGNNGSAGDGLQVGTGVTDSEIRLGALTDLTAAFGPLGKTLLEGNQIYFAERNAQGGICEREVVLEVRDHAYDVQTGVSQFSELEPQVLGLVQLLGSPIASAISPRIESTDTVTILSNWSSDFLGSENIRLVGSSYPHEMINGLSYLVEEGYVQEGDTVGHLYFEGDYGENALTGSAFAAEELGLNLEALQVAPAATDLTAEITSLQSAGAKAVLLSTSARITAASISVAESTGMDAVFLVNGAGFDPAILNDAATAIIEDRLLVMSSWAPFAYDNDKAAEIRATYAEEYPEGLPTNQVMFGYASASVLGQALDRACEAGDLTRTGVITALKEMNNVSTSGLTPELDMTSIDTPSTYLTFVNGVDSSVEGGLVVVKEPFQSEIGAAFTD